MLRTTTPPGPADLSQIPLSLKTMKMQYFVPLCLLLLLGWLGQRSEGRTVILDKCEVNVHLHELHKHYSVLRSSAISGDTIAEVKLLDKALLKKVKDGQVCCFVRLLLRFFVERVFVNYSPPVPEEQRGSSAVANAFVCIRKDIHKCHCLCEEDTQRFVDAVVTEFDRLQVGDAARKAVGEMDTVLEWLDVLSQKTQTRK